MTYFWPIAWSPIPNCRYCLVPHPRTQLLTYHYLWPSRLSVVLSQTAPRMSAASRRTSNGVVPVVSTGTRERYPTMLDTGMTHTQKNLCSFPAFVHDGGLTHEDAECTTVPFYVHHMLVKYAKICTICTTSASSPSKRNGRRRRMCCMSIARTRGGSFLFFRGC